MPGVRLALDELNPTDVKKLITARWDKFGAPGHRSLIPDNGIQSVFAEKYPIGAVIRILGMMLVEYANDWIEAGKPDNPEEMSEKLMWRCVVKMYRL